MLLVCKTLSLFKLCYLFFIFCVNGSGQTFMYMFFFSLHYIQDYFLSVTNLIFGLHTTLGPIPN
jgi:hypothetical protein